MTAFALFSGSLFRAPEQRTSKAGRPFVTATIRVKDGDALQWVRVTAFSESAQAELMRVGDGDALSVQGSFKAELYQPDGGETKLSLSGSSARASPAAERAQGSQGAGRARPGRCSGFR